MKKILYLDYLVFISVSVEVIFRDYLDLDGLKFESYHMGTNIIC